MSEKKKWRYFKKSTEEAPSSSTQGYRDNKYFKRGRSDRAGGLRRGSFGGARGLRRGRSDEAFNSERPRLKHPPGLKGREIGLWYAAQSKEKRLAEESDEPETSEIRKKKENKRPLASVLISPNKKECINKLLNDTLLMYPASFYQKTNTYEHLEETDFKHEFLQHITGNVIQKLQTSCVTGSLYKNDAQDKLFLEELEQKESKSIYRRMQEFRQKLPSMKMKDTVLDLINQNQVVVISGETGCGKTTQVAQFILDDYIKKGRGSECKIVCTQPRRISAIAVAERVAQERDEGLGKSVGYQIRLEKKMPRDRGSILYCTAGVLLKYMETNPSLSEITHVILDEIHERSVTTDFLITVIKDVIKYRSDIKIILMSATLNSEAFSKYYNNAPHLNIPGFTYPVEEYFLEDVLQFTKFAFDPDKKNRKYSASLAQNVKRLEERRDFIEPYIRELKAEKKYDRHVINELEKVGSEDLNLMLIYKLLLDLCKMDNDDGSILVFVPGFGEISALCKMINDSGHFPPNEYIVIPLHSQLPTVDQKQIFNPAPRGMRKIIISTNIAETSITIDDVTTVIDSGYIKVSRVDPETTIETLEAEWVSQANAAQRKGRAGRVKPGVCYHLVTRARYNLFEKFLEPEVLRKRLDDVILSLKMLQLGEAEPFLTKLMDPPKSSAIKTSLELLKRLGALGNDENLTPLGFHMAKLPLAAHCSKMLIMAALFSCVDPILSVVTSLGFKDAFQLSMSEVQMADEKRVELSKGSNSDHLCLHYAIRGFEDAPNPYAFCRQFYLSAPILKLLINMRQQFAEHLFVMRFISDPNPRSRLNNINSENLGLVKAIISAGLYPNVAIVKKFGRNFSVIRSLSDEMMKLHRKSVLIQCRTFSSPLLVYHVAQKTNGLHLNDATVAHPLSIIFFGDRFRIHSEDNEDDTFKGISIDGVMRFLCTEGTAVIIEKLRNRLNQILEWKISHPGFVDWTSDTPEVKILKVVLDLITAEHDDNLDLSDYDDS